MNNLDFMDSFSPQGDDLTALGQELLGTVGTKPEKLIQIRTGLSELDTTIRGLTPGKLYIVGGRPGTGKTSFGTTITGNSLNKYGFPVLYISTELTVAEVWMQVVEAYKGGIPFYSNKEYSPIKLDQLKKAISSTMAQLDRGELSIVHKKRLDEDFLSKAIDYHCEVLNGGRCSTVIIDQASRIQRNDSNKHGYAVATEHMLNHLEELADEKDVPIVLLSQLNRGVHLTNDRPGMHHFKHSGAFEEFAHCCILLHQEDEYDDAPGVYNSEIIVAKNRHGKVGIIEANFNGPGHTWTEQAKRG